MENIFSNNPIISIGICATLFGVLAFHRLALHRQKSIDYITATENFVTTITTEFSEIYPVCSKWPENIDGYLRNIFPEIQAAIETYKPYVKDKKGFEKAWNYYRLGEDGRIIDKQVYYQYMGFKINNEPTEKPEVILKQNIEKLLSYAKT